MDKSNWVNPFPNVTTRRRDAGRNDLSQAGNVTKTASVPGRGHNYESNIPPVTTQPRHPAQGQEHQECGSSDDHVETCECDLRGGSDGGSWVVFLSVLALALSLLTANLLMSFYSHYVKVKDDCRISPKEIKQRFDALDYETRGQIFGQHLAVDGALGAIYGHLTDPEPPKALVLSFHGSLGSGKTFFSHIIARNLFEGGLRSPHVKAFLGPRHFLLDPITTQENKDKLLRLVEKSMGSCGRSLFIFDEADKMPLSVLDALTPFMGHQGILDGVEYRRGIFIFISNTGAQHINNITLQALKGGAKREGLKLQDFQEVFSKEVKETKDADENPGEESPQPPPPVPWSHQLSFVVSSLWERIWSPCNCTIPDQATIQPSTDPGGLFESEVSGRGLIDQFLPFLPLQKDHVLLCIKKELRRRDLRHLTPTKILEDLDSFAWTDGDLFAKEGCKNVAPHVSRYLTQAHQNLFKTQT